MEAKKKQPKEPKPCRITAFQRCPKILSALTWFLFILPPSPLSPDGDSHLLSIQPHLWVRKGRAKETAVAQAAQSAASEVGTRGLLFASSEGFSALMSARLSLRPGKWPCLLMSASRSGSAVATFTSTPILSKLHEGLKTMPLLKCTPPNPAGQEWGGPPVYFMCYRAGSVRFASPVSDWVQNELTGKTHLENNFIIKSKKRERG